MANAESNGHVTDDVMWPRKVEGVTPLCVMPIISKTAGDRHLVTMEHLCEMAIWESNSHVTDDVRWPWKVKVVTLIRLQEEANISITAGDRGLVPIQKDRQ